MIDNVHKVPQKQWKKWGEFAQEHFNYVFEEIQRAYGNFLHPKTGKITEEEHKTIAWNAAWTAADLLRDYE